MTATSTPSAGTEGWGWLNKRISRGLLEDLPRVWSANIPQLVHESGLEMQVRDERVALRVRTDADPLVYADPLQTEEGTIRADIQAALSRDALDQPADVQEWLGVDLQHELDSGNLEVSKHGLFQAQLWANTDFVPILRGQVGTGKRFFRVGGHGAFYNRVRLLEIIDELRRGVAISDLNIGPNRRYNTLVSGIWQLYPGALICFPMTVRHQPLAAVYMTPVGSQIVMLPPVGKVLGRPMQMVTWPVGTGGQSLAGSGKGIYRQAGKLWGGDGALEILQSCVQGANSLLNWITDPGRWTDSNGHFQPDDLWLAWTSLSQGTAALLALGESWGGSSSLWDAFRALGILQGVWAGSAEGSVRLSDLLHPERLRDLAAANIRDPRLREWYTKVAGNWEEKLREGFPGRPIGEAVGLVADLRNILHGVGATGQDRARRLRILREMADTQASLQLVVDIAVMWWAAAMFSPEKAYRAGRAPWAA